MLGNENKFLIIMRHANAIKYNPALSDFQRDLTEQGIHQANLSANFLANNPHLIPQLIISSSAKRALHTAEIVADKLNLPYNIIDIKDTLYSGDLNTYIDTIYQVDDEISRLMILGHNPSISMLSYLLTNKEVNKMKTASMLGLEIMNNKWLNFDLKPKKTLFFFSPE
ncbi:MAG TPA: histidine phosphatase family protein [Bacteroidales bacterium]|jgi:phosphohistidine phosphatase|nr:histidine phosphatase family protein [Bacteroidales bacterium]MBP8947163.1 histidine phosphatase family protein [Bacteroidales bacterium]HNQ20225.1 histidine phosphatase family protein [Bacteroidales bacterium]HNW21056.1 histidine phosphatase family protein [Bacteroidales bacterium]HOH94055.1 histidine phosphatase family protein [Bacteroidales bacterium]